MDRRSFTALLTGGALGALSGVPALGNAGADATQAAGRAQLRIAALLYHDMVLLDLVAPLTIFALMGADVTFLARDREPVRTDVGIPVPPSVSDNGLPPAFDVLFVPGGLNGTVAVLEDGATLDLLEQAARRARLVTSVCTGALLLGAAGLLKGYRATGHWYIRDLLPRLGAIPAEGRVVEDRTRITAGGVTAGMDFALTLAARLLGEDSARRIQLVLEYDPRPPFEAGTPGQAGPASTADVLARRSAVIGRAASAVERARERLHL